MIKTTMQCHTFDRLSACERNRKYLLRSLRLWFGVLLITLLLACAAGGPVVTLTEVDDSSSNLKNLELKKEDLNKIQEIKKTLVSKEQ